MAHGYRMVTWDRQKRLSDTALGALVAAFLGAFAGATAATDPGATAETILIRGTALCALMLLHVILCIGPLARLDARFLPLLYNRRHLGVTMFVLALAHGALATIQFHALGDANPLVSLFTANAGGIGLVPFEAFGALALAILFLMAATSHDFWLRNLGASVWKSLHLLVYTAYGLVVAHVLLGTVQSERGAALPAMLLGGFALVVSLHLAAWRRESHADARRGAAAGDGFVDACAVEDLPPEGHGCAVVAGAERLALYRHGGRLYALSGVCRHQGGPLGEGRIVDGCATCPWHGWNYRPQDGCSPPPFEEVLPTYNLRIEGGRVLVHPAANPPGTICPGVAVEEGSR